MILRGAVCACILLALFGCSGKQEDPNKKLQEQIAVNNYKPNQKKSESETPVAVSSSSPFSLTGHGGKVSLGDTLDQAKKAFPPPPGGQIIHESMNFAILNHSGWTWVSDPSSKAERNTVFEVCLKDDKVVAIALTQLETDKAKKQQMYDTLMAGFGKPDKAYQGRTAVANAWSRGTDAQFVVNIDAGLMGHTLITVMGNADELKLLNYRADDVETLVKQMDMGAAAVVKEKR